MALNDVWMLDFVQTYVPTGEKMMNKFFYTSLDATANATALDAAFRDPVDGIVPLINNIQTDRVANASIRIINLGILADFSDLPLGGGGTDDSGDTLPMHDAVNFTLKVNTRAVRPGSKRFSGILEANVTDGVITDSNMILFCGQLEIGMAASINDSDATFLPVVVKRVGLPLGTPPYSSYRLPETDGELVMGGVVAALVNVRISHQVSRGNGR